MSDRLRLATALALATSAGCAKRNFTPATPTAPAVKIPTLTAEPELPPQPSPATPAALALTDDQVALGGSWFGGLPATFVALGLDASILTAPVQNDGRFQLALDKGTSYVLVVVPGTVAANGASLALLDGAPGVSRVKIATLGLDDIPTQRVQGPLELGTLAGSGGVVAPVRDFDQAKLLKNLGLTEAEARVVGRWDDGTSLYSTLDGDGDGRVDALAGRQPRLALHYAWGREANAGTLNAAAQDLVDLEAVLRDDNHVSTTLVWSLPWSETLPPRVKLSFPQADVCGDGATCVKAATGLTSDLTVDMENRTATTRFVLDARADGVKPVPPQGDYGIDAGDDGKWTFRNVRPRTLDNDRGLAAPAVRLKVSDGKLTGVGYAWKVNDLISGQYRLMTPAELALLFTGSPEANATLTCNGVNGGVALDCRLPLTKISGDVSGIACVKGWTGQTLDEIASCEVKAEDIFGTVVSYQLFR